MSDTNAPKQNYRERVDVFLSSRQDDDNARTLRKNIFDLANELGLSVWQPPPKPPNTSADEILEECLYYLTKADLYICILVDTYGTNQEALANLSILELEIFHAVLSQKTPYFFAIKPFEPSKELSTLLDALNIISPGLIKYYEPEEALQRIKGILENRRRLWLSQRLARLWSNFSTDRENRRRDTNEEALSAVFLNGSFVPFAFKAEPDEKLIRRLLEKAARTSHEPTKLVYLWAAVRNLILTCRQVETNYSWPRC
jgi:hypothetical protein